MQQRYHFTEFNKQNHNKHLIIKIDFYTYFRIYIVLKALKFIKYDYTLIFIFIKVWLTKAP